MLQEKHTSLPLHHATSSWEHFHRLLGLSYCQETSGPHSAPQMPLELRLLPRPTLGELAPWIQELCTNALQETQDLQKIEEISNKKKQLNPASEARHTASTQLWTQEPLVPVAPVLHREGAKKRRWPVNEAWQPEIVTFVVSCDWHELRFRYYHDSIVKR